MLFFLHKAHIKQQIQTNNVNNIDFPISINDCVSSIVTKYNIVNDTSIIKKNNIYLNFQKKLNVVLKFTFHKTNPLTVSIGVMTSVFASSAVNRGFEHRSGETND